MVKKIVSLLTVSVLAAALFCGCWGKDDSSSSSMAKATPTPAAPSSGSLNGDSMMPDNSTTPGNSGSMGNSGSIGSGVTPGSSMMPDSGMNSGSASVKPTRADWNTRIVNAENPLTGDFSVKTRSIAKYPDRSFDERAAGELEAMLDAAAKDGYPLYLVSAYRSVARQKALYERKVNWYLGKGYEPELARTQAAKWVAVPGTSEHNLGLAADIVSAKWYNTHDDLTAEFEETPEFEWLMAHCTEYGFVLRYPEDKTGKTGVVYEPWHYRYVGREAAEYLMTNNLCLEELE